tara:strand:- start:67 stop:534 length:468 start_codon:yes stop_codon:yes gene_type:complete
MKNQYINIYNNLVNLTRNKNLYKNFNNTDEFQDRLTYFLFHLAFFLKVFKEKNDKKILQDIYDYCFRQLELSIREIGYGDQTVNKKMKDYINLFYAILDKLENWEAESHLNKIENIAIFLNEGADKTYLIDYFENYRQNLLNITLNSYLKGVINH